MAITKIILPALQELDLGRYTQAKSLLTALLTAHEADIAACHHITTELVRAYLLSGDFRTAMDLIDRSLAQFPEAYMEQLERRQGCAELDSSCVYLVLVMQKAFSRLITEGLTNDAVKTAARVAKLLPSELLLKSSAYTRQVVCIRPDYL
jgi:hypothetical protein